MDLPFDVDEELPEPAPGSTLASSVLLVDDEPVVLDVFTHLLSREQDLDLTTADSFETGLAHLTNRRFDLLVTDKNLPTHSGIELVAEARRLRPGIEAIVITGYASAESVVAALAAGASDYLTKPFDQLSVVRAKLRASLDRRAARVQGRQAARAIAQEAAALLSGGKKVDDSAWDRLEVQLGVYEAAYKEGGDGKVLVIARPEITASLRAEGFNAEASRPDNPALEGAEVVVIDTEWAGWLGLAERLRPSAADVLLVARPHADLGDLLDAISLRIDLVGFGATSRSSTLPEHLRALLLRRSVQKAQAKLSACLAEFRAAVGG
ncbi:MAG: response regulator [Myxococcaceae bacterium]